MTGMTCRKTLKLLSKRASGLTDAERWYLEDHLSECAGCRSDERALTALTTLARSSEVKMPARARERIIETALRSAGTISAETREVTRRPARRIALGAFAVAAAAGLLIALAVRGSGNDGIALSKGDAKPEKLDGIALSKSDRSNEKLDGIALSQYEQATKKLDGIALSATGSLVSGTVRVAGIDLSAAGDPIPSGAEIQSADGAEVLLDRARVTLRPHSTISWNAARDAVELRRGAVRAKVVSVPGRAFRISTPRFAAVVVGTELEVTSSMVKVHQGIVRVVASDEKVLAAVVEAGHEWHFERGVVPTKVAAAQQQRPAIDARAALTRARALLASRDIEAARAAIKEVLAAKSSSSQRAEARTLLAECALVSGDRADAIRLYLQVARRYRGLTAGQNALFAAARLEALTGHEAAARKHLRLYLGRYPNGTFRDDARRRLQKLEGR